MVSLDIPDKLLDTDRFYCFGGPELSQSDTGRVTNGLFNKSSKTNQYCRKPPKEDLLYSPRKDRARLPEWVTYKLLCPQRDAEATRQQCNCTVL